jgi:uncharacterized phage-associated protein
MRKEDVIANFFISLGMTENESEDYMTNLRLNKLMYFAQAWSLVLLKKPLFHESVEAWPLGPVIPSIYHKYKLYGKSQITTVDPSFHLSMLGDDEQQVLFATMARYGEYSTHGLVDLSHEDGSPWAQACDAKTSVILSEDIRNFFSKQTPLKLSRSIDSDSVVGYHNANDTYVLPVDWQ